VIGSIGRLDGNKNYSMLLRVFATLHNKWEMLRLLIIGEGPLKSQLLDLAKQLGIASKVRFPGAIPLAARYLPAMEICCLTSYTEGVPNVVMEAASAGLPVISTRCGDSAYLIEHDLSGYLVSPDDDVAMGQHLDRLLSSPEQRARMGQAGRDKMHREFGINHMVERMTKLYEELLKAKRGSEAYHSP
jgi:glycosyltransferase involved in cell wall biosynthesis